MSDIFKILNNIQNIDRIAILVRVLNMKAVKDFIIFQNTENQLRLGLDSKGDIVGLYRSFSYSSMKQNNPGRKATFGIVDLHLSGKYYKSYTVEVLNDGSFIIDSDTDKGETDLAEKYGEDIEGLIDKNFENVIDFAQPIYMNELEKDIHK